MKPKLTRIMVLVIALGLVWAAGANAQLTVYNSNVPSDFTQLGIIQQATLNAGGANAGGTLTINGIKMIVPANTVIQMPANTLTWAQLFDPLVSRAIYDNSITPKPVTINHRAGVTGLALSDNLQPGTRSGVLGTSPPWLPFNATVMGNIDVSNSRGFGVGAYIVGLILPIDQDLGNGGAGFINFIDYASGRFEVGGTLNVPNTGTIIEINDPAGRHGKAHSPDPRWCVDHDNPTVATGNGYPMGIPKVAPPLVDPDRPYTNRPLNGDPAFLPVDPFVQVGAPLQAFFMPPSAAAGSTVPDPWKQVPFMVGDYVGFSGMMCRINPNLPLNPNVPWNRQVYISANTVGSDNLAVYTDPGAGPCYVQFPIGHFVVGTGGASVTVPPNPALGIGGGVDPIVEPKTNIALHGWCTDSTQIIDVYALDWPAGAANPTPRLLGSVLPEPGFAAGKGNKGRFRFDIGKGAVTPPTRNYMAVSQHNNGVPIQLPDQAGINNTPLTGLLSGQYQAPMFGFQFADPPPGFPRVAINFQDFPFLVSGEGATPALNPFPPFIP